MPADFYLSDSSVEAFQQDGYIILPQLIDGDLLARLRSGMQRRVQELLRRYQALGQGDGAGDDLNDNLVRLLAISSEAYQHIDISLPMLPDYGEVADSWRTLFGGDWRQEAGVYTDPTIFELLTHPNIIRVARRLLGDEIVASPVQHVRIKPPQRALSGGAAIDANTARTLWHQDEAVVNESARGVNILTVWVAITEATPENGCMQAVRGSHLQAEDSSALPDYGLTAHCPGKQAMVAEIYIPDHAVDRTQLVPLPASPGDVVLLDKRTVHGAGSNDSEAIRWSFDLRYQPAGTPTGRECFPAALVHSVQQPRQVLGDAAAYRAMWLTCRDQIISKEVSPSFNTRWLKYGETPICA